MTPSSDEITRLQVKRSKIKETIATVLDFPKKLSYDCMLPLSKMAFMPAKMIHTNEFLVLPEKQSIAAKGDKIDEELSLAEIRRIGKWHSYSESAEILMDRVASIDRRIDDLKTSGDSRNARSEQKKLPSKPVLSVQKIKVNQTDIRKDLNTHESQGHIFEDGEDTDNLRGSGGIEGIYEIREFIDNDGNETKHEIVNLHEEMEQIEKKMGSLDENKSSSARSPSTKGVDAIKSFVDSLNRLPPNKGEEHFEQNDHEFEDGDRIKVNRNSPSDILDRLEDLENEEDEMLIESEAADRIRLQERESQQKALPQASAGGWQKGFFSKASSHAPLQTPIKSSLENSIPKKNGKSVAFLDVPTLPQTFVSDNTSVPVIPTINSKGTVSVSPVVKAQATAQNSNYARTEAKENGILKKNVPISKAFSGNVMERFP